MVMHTYVESESESESEREREREIGALELRSMARYVVREFTKGGLVKGGLTVITY